MSTPVIQMQPEGMFSIKDLDKFLFELERRWRSKDILHHDEAAEYLGISSSKLYRIPKSVLPYHEVEGLKGRLYLKSELIDKIKNVIKNRARN